jgi:hypothetical protein
MNTAVQDYALKLKLGKRITQFVVLCSGTKWVGDLKFIIVTMND